MKNKLQYAYSITVFIGVLVTTYLMMNKEGSTRVPLRAVQAPVSTLRSEAGLVDSGVSQLFEMQDQLSRLPAQRSPVPKSNKELTTTSDNFR